jgi:hypothetical protein
MVIQIKVIDFVDGAIRKESETQIRRLKNEDEVRIILRVKFELEQIPDNSCL